MAFEKKYDPKKSEKEIREFWEKNNIYKFNQETKKEIFSIDTPPPTISGKMHIGHAFSYTQTDFIARYKRMKGYEVFYPFGTDDNGLATEKLVQKNKKVNLRNVSREDAVKITMEYLKNERPAFVSDFKNVGLSCDFDINYSTISPYSQKISQKTFIDLYNKGLIEQREGPVPWDRVFQTTIAQAELEDVERKAYLNYVKAKISNSKNTYMIYATTRPELCFAVVGMSVEDKGEYVKLKVGDEYWITGAKTYEEKFKKFEYKVVEKLKGQDLISEKVTIPIVDREVEISHDIAVKADFGTGIAYFCTYGGLEDIEWTARHNTKPIEVLDKAGKLNNKCKKYEGILAENARKEIIEELETKNHLIFKEEKTQVVNVGERSGAEVEYLVTKQWYVKYLDKKEYFWENAQKFSWHPEFMKHRLENWIDGLNWDWGFSRQRHFGIPIPVWQCKKCQKHHLANESSLPIDPTKDKPPIDKCECGSTEFIPEKDVFDTWFTSASSPFLSINMITNQETKKKLFPMSLRPQAHDIINFWLFYTMAKTNLLYNKNPFENVAVSGWMLDPQGKKMSKSKGNTIAPQEVVEKFSNDAIRFLAGASKLGQDMPYQEKEVQTGIKVANKIFNANKFASMLLENFKSTDKLKKDDKLNSIDKWILGKLEKTLKKATDAFDKFDYASAKYFFEQLFLKDIADNYIEIVKQRLWKPEEFGIEETLKAQKTLYEVLFASLKGFAPIMPYITEQVYQNFYKNYEKEKSIHKCNWPENKYSIEDETINCGDNFISILTAVRKYKSENNVSMKNPIEKLTIECDEKTKEFIENSMNDLKAVTSAKIIEFDKGEITTEKNDIKISIILEKNDN